MKQGIATFVILTSTSAAVLGFMTWFVVTWFAISSAIHSADGNDQAANQRVIAIRSRLPDDRRPHLDEMQNRNGPLHPTASSDWLSYWNAE